MKLKAITLALFVAGIASSYALADNGGGNGKGKKEAVAATTTAATTTTSGQHGKGKAKQADRKVAICHKAGKGGKFVKISVSKQALKAHKKHGDVDPVDGKCATQAPPTTTTSTTTTSTTTATTTTAAQ